MSITQALSGLLHTLYAAPAQPRLWPGFLKDFTHFLNLPAAAIMHQNWKTGEGVIRAAWGLNPDGMRLYGEHYGKLDEYRAAIIREPKKDFVFAEHILPLQLLRKTEFYNDFLTKYGQLFLCGIVMSRTASSFENISLYYDMDSDLPGKETLDRLTLLLPHLKSAIEIQRHLFEAEAKANDLVAALNSQRVGIILIEEGGTCFFVNRAAELLISRQDGLYLRNSRLFATMGQESAGLQSLIRRATATTTGKELSGGGTMPISRRMGKPLQALVTTFLAENLNVPKRALAMVLISDPEQQPMLSVDVLRSLYGLTPAEAGVSIQLASGKSLEEVCDGLSIRYATGRAHLRSIFDKVGVRRQGELVSRLLCSVTAQEILSPVNSHRSSQPTV